MSQTMVVELDAPVPPSVEVPRVVLVLMAPLELPWLVSTGAVVLGVVVLGWVVKPVDVWATSELQARRARAKAAVRRGDMLDQNSAETRLCQGLDWVFPSGTPRRPCRSEAPPIRPPHGSKASRPRQEPREVVSRGGRGGAREVAPARRGARA